MVHRCCTPRAAGSMGWVRARLAAALLAVAAAAAVGATATTEVRLAVLLLIRDEASLVRDHLPLWLPLAYCAVAAVDERTVDDSAAAFMEATDGAPSLVAAEAAGKLRPAVLRRFAYHFSFEGLGPARTGLLREAASRFPEATHALFVDPDWRPVRATAGALRSAAATGKTALAFRVRDRNGRTERLLDWCFAMDGGAYVKYRWHEELVHPAYDAALLDWDVDEVAGADRGRKRERNSQLWRLISRPVSTRFG